MAPNYRIKVPWVYERTHSIDAEVELSDPSHDHPENTSMVEEHSNSLSHNAWGLEVLTSIASLLIFCVIIVIFIRMDNRPLTYWTFSISINAIISILTTMCTAAMMHNVSSFISQLKWLHFKGKQDRLYNLEYFDGASRGPYGSIVLISRVRWNLATLGALITISRLGFAPFTQQVIDLQPRNVTIEDPSATFGFSHEYDRHFTHRDLANTGTDNLKQDPSMEAAILQGVYNITTPSVFSCPGTCSWNSSYISIGFKSVCENVTTTTLKTKTCVFDNDGSVTICNMTTPKGIGLSLTSQDTNYATILQLNDTLPPMDMIPDIVNIAVYRSSIKPNGNITQGWNENITECTLSMAAYNYSGAYAQGNTFSFASIDEVKIASDLWNWQFNEWHDVADNDLEIGQIWTNGSEAGVPRLVLGYGDFTSLRAYFQSDMILTEWRDGGGWPNTNYGISPALIGDVNLPGLFEKMAESMTDYLRSGPNHQLANGTSIESVVFVSIRWPWMIGPACVELAAAVFALLTIFRSKKYQQVPLWKSSITAVLDYHHDKELALLRNGQPLVHRQQNLDFIPEWERVVIPPFDYLLEEKRCEVDSERLALFSYSFGDYLAAPAAAFEPRISAVLLNGGVWDTFDSFSAPLSLALLQHHCQSIARSTRFTYNPLASPTATPDATIMWPDHCITVSWLRDILAKHHRG
ncbi:hypothetical protein PFICI_03826 [Pestalotiopsis fici W106-1]|uniref:Uncharacterized protein n=1 Tax=Pestalotiopsis fici (strain W106-1 / CGMCC3.15140) TaxID=1229662 RepID=W3XKQ0_PESFW|nr:uncharacterized protein PFICI_03826 [Pestalotiopsis fici W106-1]ETS85801.1 hypothetical protein PFICI_03826 [Pestalotiopsis fici W106-1]